MLVIAGLAMGLGAGSFCLLVAVSADCEGALRGSHHWICTGGPREVLAWMEGALVLGALLGPVLGGIAGARAGRTRRVAIGTAIGFICVALQIQLAEQQTAVPS